MKNKNISISELNVSEYKTSLWDFSNSVLYKLCEENFWHKEDEIILTKVLFVGRIYAVALERRKTSDGMLNDEFYIQKVVPVFKNFLLLLDDTLLNLKDLKLTKENIPKILMLHYNLMKAIKEITDLDKRSFCSKYLHFHLPDLFFIYDSLACSALSKFIKKVPDELQDFITIMFRAGVVDKEYAIFFCKCFVLKEAIEKEYNTEFSIRAVDNLLLKTANKTLKEKYHCPICKAKLKLNTRYPNYICNSCASKATDENGKILSFFNIDFSGGFQAKYKETGENYNSHICYIDNIKCYADEARFGGIVIEVIK